MKKKINIEKSEVKSFSNNIKLLVVYLSIFVILLMLYVLRSVLLPFFIALILAYIMNPIVNYFERKGIRRILVIVLIFVVFVAVTTIALNVFIDYAGSEISSIQQKLPQISDKVKSLSDRFADYVSRTIPGLSKDELKSTFTKSMGRVSENIGEYIVRLFAALLASIGGIIGQVLNIFIVVFVLFFFLKDWKRIKEYIMELTPVKYHIIISKLTTSVNVQVSNYVRGQVIVTSIVGILSIGGLYLLGFDYSFILGAIVGITNIIPVMGPIIGICIGIIMSVFSSQTFILSAIKVIFVLGIVQILDNTLISPLVLGSKVKIHPVTVVLSLSLGWYFLGIIGMLIAIPFYTSMKLILIEIYRYYR